MPSTDVIILVAIVLLALALIFSRRVRADLAAILVMLALQLSGVITPQQALDGFSRPAVITILSMFIVARALEQTGVIGWISDRLCAVSRGHEARLTGMIMAVAAALTSVVNIIAVGTMLLPAVLGAARDLKLRPSKLLIPLAYGALLGGTATYFATANIIVSGMLVAEGLPGLRMTDFLPTGSLIVVSGIAYMLLVGRRLLPDRQSPLVPESARSLSRSLFQTYSLDERLWEVQVDVDSPLAGVSLRDSRIGECLGLTVLAVWRDGHSIVTPEPAEVLRPCDYVYVMGREDRVRELVQWGFTLASRNGNGASHDYPVSLTEVIVSPRSAIAGKTLTDVQLRQRHGVTATALWREGRSVRTDVGHTPLHAGDALLMVGTPGHVEELFHDPDFLVTQSAHKLRPYAPHKAPIALLITAGVVLSAVFAIVPTAEAALAGAIGLILAGCLTVEDAYRAVDLRVIFLVAGMSSVSVAAANTGLSADIGAFLVGTFAPAGPLAVLAALFVATMLATQAFSAQVTALILGPLAVTVAGAGGLNPHAVAVVIATACSTAFLTPLAHPINLLVMAPANYRQQDYLRVGFGLVLVTFAALMLGLTLFWNIG